MERVMESECDSSAGGGSSCVVHTRGTDNSSFTGGESGATVAPSAAVDHCTPKIDLNPVIAMVTVPNVSSVAFAASAGANENGSGWGDFEKPLDMLLAEKLEKLKENENDSMDEGVQEDEQFVIEIDNEETGGRESSSANESSEEDDERWKCRSDPNRVEWVAGILVQGQHAQEERSKQNMQLTKHSKLKFSTRGIGNKSDIKKY